MVPSGGLSANPRRRCASPAVRLSADLRGSANRVSQRSVSISGNIRRSLSSTQRRQRPNLPGSTVEWRSGSTTRRACGAPGAAPTPHQVEARRQRPTPHGGGASEPKVTRTRWTAAVVDHPHAKRLLGDFNAVEPGEATPQLTPRVLDHDLVSRGAPSVIAKRPRLGNAGIEAQPSPCMRSPRMLSTPARCIQPAEPVYQVQPPRPTCGGVA